MVTTFAELSKSRKATDQQAYEAFDSLPAVSVNDLVGWRWKGYEIETGHPLNGSLEANNWFGKEFFDVDNGHPLLTYNSVDPKDRNNDDLWPLHPPILFGATQTGETINGDSRAKAESKTTSCSLKTIRFRDKITASMFYDDVPVNDTFAKVDDNTVYGIMDYKYLKQPLFFVLEKYKPLSEVYPESKGKYVAKQ